MQQSSDIRLTPQNSLQILAEYVEISQQKGAYFLPEADLLKRATDVLLKQENDPELTVITARQVLIQGVHKGQRHGAFTLNDASLLHRVIAYLTAPETEKKGETGSSSIRTWV